MKNENELACLGRKSEAGFFVARLFDKFAFRQVYQPWLFRGLAPLQALCAKKPPAKPGADGFDVDDAQIAALT
jgi:hypothetical protein